MRVKILLFCGLIAYLHAQPAPGDLLQRVTQKVSDTLDRLPKYMCTLTIDRLQYEPSLGMAGQPCESSAHKQVRLTTSDRLRLDVATSGAQEMYSWVGESNFGNGNLFQMVRTGAISNGNFASFLMAVFRDDAALFSYKGETINAGRQLVEFEFRVPVQSSHYTFSEGRVRVITGYSGSIMVDPKTADLVSMTIQTDALPPETDSCESRTSLDYGRVRLNGADFLLPNRVQLHILKTNGVDLENSAAFANCHEFLGESTLSFDAAPEADAAAAVKAANAWNPFPEGIRFTIELTKEIDDAVAAAGEKVNARLTTAITDANHHVLAPKGAAVTGRIIQIRRFHLPEPALRLVFKLETVEAGGAPRSLIAGPYVTVLAPNNVKTRLQSRNTPAMLDNQDPQAVVFQFWDIGKRFVLRPGFESQWSTRDR